MISRRLGGILSATRDRYIVFIGTRALVVADVACVRCFVEADLLCSAEQMCTTRAACLIGVFFVVVVDGAKTMTMAIILCNVAYDSRSHDNMTRACRVGLCERIVQKCCPACILYTDNRITQTRDRIVCDLLRAIFAHRGRTGTSRTATVRRRDGHRRERGTEREGQRQS